MLKKLLIIFIVGILGFFVFGVNSCKAIGSPGGLNPCGVGDQPLSILFEWSDVSGAHHYELYYKKTTDTSWQDRYPSESQYQVTGLSPERDYEWFVVSCGDLDCANSANSSICSFITEELELPNGNGNGNGGSPIDLINPLRADTLGEALNNFLNFLFFLGIAIGPILIIYAAFLLLTAAGDATKINKAKTIFFWTLIALAIILLAKGLPSVIKGTMGG